MKPGDWGEHPHYGEVVITAIDERFIAFRYRGHVPGRDMWVLNGEPVGVIAFLREGDAESQRVLTLRGPYGEGPILPPSPPERTPRPRLGRKATEEELWNAEFDDPVFNCWRTKAPNFREYDMSEPEAEAIFEAWRAYSDWDWDDWLESVGWTQAEYTAMVDKRILY